MDGQAGWWILFGLAAAAAVYCLVRLRGALRRAAALGADVERLEGELRDARQQLDKRAGAQRRQSDHDRETRRKLEKARKRASLARAEQQGEIERVRQIEGQLRQREADLKGLREEIARLSAASVAPERAADREAQLASAKQEISRLTARVEKAEATAAAATAENERSTQKLEKEVARLRRKAATQDMLYASIRSELEVKKDRLRTQTEELERLRAYKVALLEPMPRGAELSPSEPEAADPAAPASGTPAGAEDAESATRSAPSATRS